MMCCRFMLLYAVLVLFASTVDARVIRLADWKEEDAFTSRTSNAPSQKYQAMCESHGGVSKEYAKDNGYVCASVFSPTPTLFCYRDCTCASKFAYTTENCRADAGRVPGGQSCMNTYYTECNCNTTIYKYKEGDPSCKSQSGVCTGDSGTYYSVCNK